MHKALKKMKGYTGRVMRDLRCQLDDIPEGRLRDRIIAKLALVSHLQLVEGLHVWGVGIVAILISRPVSRISASAFSKSR
jgi:hypothetical protein